MRILCSLFFVCFFVLCCVVCVVFCSNLVVLCCVLFESCVVLLGGWGNDDSEATGGLSTFAETYLHAMTLLYSFFVCFCSCYFYVSFLCARCICNLLRLGKSVTFQPQTVDFAKDMDRHGRSALATYVCLSVCTLFVSRCGIY